MHISSRNRRLGSLFQRTWDPHVARLSVAAGTLAPAGIPAPALLGALPATTSAALCYSGGSLRLKPVGANPVGVSGRIRLDLLRGVCWCGGLSKEGL